MSQFKRWGSIGLGSILIVPTLVYLGGGLLAGPYEGTAGLFGLMGVIYADALRGNLNAWVLLLSPLLLLAIWKACGWLSRAGNSQPSA